MNFCMPLSLYIHIPWCIRKCPYCDFNSHTLRGELPESVYFSRLANDLSSDLSQFPQSELISIFIGGGTPSLTSAQAYKKLFTEISNKISFKADTEITLEANPGTFEQRKFDGYREAGINRLSIGCQSFNSIHLKALGRIHGPEEAIRAAHMAKQAGFSNFNLDLMFGLPEQTLEQALTDLQTAIGLKPTHISWYQLTLEPNTLFHARPPRLPDADLIAEMQEQGQALLSRYGYHPYEVSAYAKEGKQCRHNRNYWEFGDYIGIGAGAHGKITDMNSGKVYRTLKHKHPKLYMSAQTALAERQEIVSSQLPFEFMLNALRLQEPIPVALFEERTGIAFTAIQPALTQAMEKDLLVIQEDYFYPSPLGRRFLNDLIELFL